MPEPGPVPAAAVDCVVGDVVLVVAVVVALDPPPPPALLSLFPALLLLLLLLPGADDDEFSISSQSAGEILFSLHFSYIFVIITLLLLTRGGVSNYKLKGVAHLIVCKYECTTKDTVGSTTLFFVNLLLLLQLGFH